MGERVGERKRTSEKERKKEREERDLWNGEDNKDTDILIDDVATFHSFTPQPDPMFILCIIVLLYI